MTMAVEDFLMPSLGADMESGTVIEWLKQPGDLIGHGDVVVVVETDKGAIEVECYQPGRLAELLVQTGLEVPVGTPLARIEATGEDRAAAADTPPPAPQPSAPAQPPMPPAAPALQAKPPSTPPPSEPVRDRPHASPAARRMAREQDVDLAEVTGTGPHGAITSEDVRALVERRSRPATPAARTAGQGRFDQAGMRRAIAAAMAKSKREIPHYYLGHEVDLTVAQEWLAATNAVRAPTERLLLGVVLLKSAARALARYPEFNGFWQDRGFQPGTGVHLGTAVAIRGGGLVAPAIHDADTRPLDELMAHLRELVARVRAGRLRSSELTDATATVSSLGDRGVEVLHGVIYPPQVALIGIGRPTVRPCVVAKDALAARLMVTVTLAGDHRANDGHRGSLLLGEIAKLLQHPEKL